MSRLLFGIGIVGLVLAGVVFVVQRDANPCDVLAERHLIDSISDFHTGGAFPSIELAVEAAFAEAGIPREFDAATLDPIVPTRGNVVHVGADGYWVVLATVRGGYVPVEWPRPCSVLDR